MIRLLRRFAFPAVRLEMGESNMGRVIPRAIELHGRRAKALAPLLLACALLAIVPPSLFAQAADNTYYIAFPSFNIPFRPIDDPRVADVSLYVTTDKKEYHLVGTVKPTARGFFYQSRGDGWYYFVVQTRDQAGTLNPADVRKATPSINICVDTRIPVIEELTSIPAPSGLPTIHWKINKSNLKEIKALYRSTSGGEWLPLPLPAPGKQEDSFTWKPAWGGELEVSMEAFDLAGHRSDVKTVRLRVAENVERMRPPAEASGPGKVIYVKRKSFQLDYQLDDQTVGPSQVASVDIWKLHKGRGWEKCKESGTPRGPATVTVDETGRWGFRLIPRSGVGLAERDPRPGDVPDIWVEVDDKAPQVRVTNVTVTQEQDGGYLTVYWKAEDTYLRHNPITIFMATTPQANDWKPLPNGGNLPNSGSWRCSIDDLKLERQIYQFYLKVEAADEAGNIGADAWREVVKVDLKIPRIKSINVNPSGAPAGEGQDTSRLRAPYDRRSSDESASPTSPYTPSSNPLPRTPLPSRSPPAASPTNGTNGGFSTPTPGSPGMS
jgi:hypothetical protein